MTSESPGDRRKRQRAANRFARALEAHQSGDLPLAERRYLKVLELQRKHLGALNNLGEALRQQDKLAQAVGRFEQALSVQPEAPGVLKNMALALRDLGELSRAEATTRRSIALDDSDAQAWFLLGEILVDSDAPSQATEAYERCLSLDPADTFGAALRIAHLDSTRLPQKTSDAYVEAVYKHAAGQWDESASGRGRYRGPELLLAALRPFVDQERSLVVLDAGCGTCLGGPLLRPLARKLVGVDLSPHMLAHAQHKDLYDALHAEDLVTFVDRSGGFDLIICAAVLIHFGDLEKPLSAFRRSLNPQGLLAFTTFEDAREAILVNRFGYYTHSGAYVRQILGGCGFEVLYSSTEVQEYHAGQPVACLVSVARRRD